MGWQYQVRFARDEDFVLYIFHYSAYLGNLVTEYSGVYYHTVTDYVNSIVMKYSRGDGVKYV